MEKNTEAALDELRAAICAVGIVGEIGGHAVIRRDSVIGLIDRRRAEASGSESARAIDGWRHIAVSPSFDELMTALDYGNRKGFLPDAIQDEWDNFEWRELATSHPAPQVVAEGVGSIDRLLTMLSNDNGRIVNTAQLDGLQIAIAESEKRMYVRDDTMGFVYLPEGARTMKERAPSNDGLQASHRAACAEFGSTPPCTTAFSHSAPQAAAEGVLHKIADNLELYAENYEAMARQNKDDPRVHMISVATDIRNNMKGFVLEQIAAATERPAIPAQGQSESVTLPEPASKWFRFPFPNTDYFTKPQMITAIRAAQEQAASCPDGWKLVPVKPTMEMIDAVANIDDEHTSPWATYLASAPTPPAAPQPRELTDADIEQTFKARGGSWDGNRWVIEDADFHPMIRSFLSTPPAQKA